MSLADRPLRVVLDTNVLFSAVAFPKKSPPLQILDKARLGRLQAFASPFILGELEKNLKNKLSWDEIQLKQLRKALKKVFTLVHPTIQLNVIKRCAADNCILECAVESKAHVLVTGNMKDIRPLGAFQGIEILTPREFLQKYS